jgi:uncharacterized membrane protein YdcZ (DUF606 family)
MTLVFIFILFFFKNKINKIKFKFCFFLFHFYNFMKGIFVIRGTLILFDSLGRTLTQLVVCGHIDN